jgi:sugar phosphate isomerase/epimerase
MPLSRRELIASAALLQRALGAGEQAISLAAWSFNASFRLGKWKLLDLPGILRDHLKIAALEHVNQFFENPTLDYLKRLKRSCSEAGVRSTILMCDQEGSTASPDKAERVQSAIQHRKWIDTAHFLGCISVRVNVYGGAQNWKEDRDLADRAAETMHMMLDYARGSDLNIIVENHGGASSDPDVLVALTKKVNHPKFGLLCDLGNWNKGDDRYANVKKILPYAKGLPVKGTWGPQLDPTFDAEKLVRIALEGGYTGFWGLEVTRRSAIAKPTAEQQFADEVQTVLEAKALTERVIFKKS